MTTYFKQGLDVTGDVNVVGSVTVSETVTSNDIDVGELIIYQSYIQHSDNNNSIGFDNDNNLVITGYTGEVQLYANADGGTQPWQFKSTGELQTPDSGVININGTTLTDSSFSVAGSRTATIESADGDVVITSNAKSWTFTDTGVVTFPDSASINSTSSGITLEVPAGDSIVLRTESSDVITLAPGQITIADETVSVTDGQNGLNINSGNISLSGTGSVEISGVLGSETKVGTVVNAGTVTIGNGTNLVDFTEGSTVDFTNTTVTGITTENITITEAPTDLNHVVRLSDLVSVPGDLAITAIGSLDLQMTVANPLASSVDSVGVPAYISNLSDSSSIGDLTIAGNASSLGTNYTVMRAYYDANSYKTSGSISMVLDIAKACNLEDNKFLVDGVTINPKWKGNFRINAFSALFKMSEINFWDYATLDSSNPAPSSTWEYSVNMTPVTNDPDAADYGKYTVSSRIFAAAYYHNANLGARWMGFATKYRNIT